MMSSLLWGCADDSSEIYEQNVRAFTESLLTSDVDQYLAYEERFEGTQWHNETDRIESLEGYGLFDKFSSSCSPQIYGRLLEVEGCNIFTVSRYAYEHGFDSISPSEIDITLESEDNETLNYLVKCDVVFVIGNKTVTRPTEFIVSVNGWKDGEDAGLVGQYHFEDSLFLNPLYGFGGVLIGK